MFFFFSPLTLQLYLHPSWNINACDVPVYMSTVQKCNIFPIQVESFQGWTGLESSLNINWKCMYYIVQSNLRANFKLSDATADSKGTAIIIHYGKV